MGNCSKQRDPQSRRLFNGRASMRYHNITSGGRAERLFCNSISRATKTFDDVTGSGSKVHMCSKQCAKNLKRKSFRQSLQRDKAASHSETIGKIKHEVKTILD